MLITRAEIREQYQHDKDAFASLSSGMRSYLMEELSAAHRLSDREHQRNDERRVSQAA